jgi:hypothetical protein
MMLSQKHWFEIPRALVVAALLSCTLAWSQAAADDRVQVIHVNGAANIMRAERSADGAIHLVYDSADGPIYVRSTDDGANFTSPIPVVDDPQRKPGLEYTTWDMAVDGEGRVHLALGTNAWKLKWPQTEWGLFYTALAPGAKEFSSVRNINHKPSEGFSLAAGRDGSVTANFLSGKLYTMASHDRGQTFSPFAEINPAFDPCKCCTTSTTFGSDGRMAVLYREEANNERDIYLVLADPRGGNAPTRTKVSTASWKLEGCPMTYFSIRPTSTGYVAAWPTKGDIYFAKLDKNGAVLPPGEIKTPGRSGMRTGILALNAEDGSTLVVWKYGERLCWQLYDSAAAPQGQPGAIASTGKGAAAVVLPSGKFLLFP